MEKKLLLSRERESMLGEGATAAAAHLAWALSPGACHAGVKAAGVRPVGPTTSGAQPAKGGLTAAGDARGGWAAPPPSPPGELEPSSRAQMKGSRAAMALWACPSRKLLARPPGAQLPAAWLAADAREQLGGGTACWVAGSRRWARTRRGARGWDAAGMAAGVADGGGRG